MSRIGRKVCVQDGDDVCSIRNNKITAGGSDGRLIWTTRVDVQLRHVCSLFVVASHRDRLTQLIRIETPRHNQAPHTYVDGQEE